MSMFTFAISSLTPSNLPWSMGETFQVPMRYCFFIASDFIFTMDTSTIECHFCYGPVTSFFLELLAPLSPVAYWTLCNPGRVGGWWLMSLCLFILVLGFLGQEYWSGLPLPPPVDHILSELFTMTCCLGWPCTVWLTASLSYQGPSPQEGYDPWRTILGTAKRKIDMKEEEIFKKMKLAKSFIRFFKNIRAL